ncbi:hypothetical protein D9757_001451 [Collybiopsis confluens]|uniref:XRRM domain-containing protein n=1 Tax=Collybiopsis confluens TaxID=2823264 RepID=A0A8H5HZI1_9AGAR|nr:hypothetical protein D9757_001451 [Collybiopsis confluens]
MSLAFIPRKLGKKTGAPSTTASTSGSQISTDIKAKNPALNDAAPSASTSHVDDNSATLAEEVAALVVLSMTDHEIWANGDLRRRLEESNEGFLPLRYILKHSTLIQEYRNYESQSKMLSESAIVKSLRKHSEDDVQVRMVFSGPTWSKWGASSASSSSSRTDAGMYEIRPKKYVNSEAQEEVYTRDYWEKRTVYIENIPPSHRSLPRIYHCLRNVCRLPASERLKDIKIQRIWFPPHYLDTDNDPSSQPTPKGKAFAFAVLSSPEEVAHVTNMWNWQRSCSVPNSEVELSEPTSDQQRTSPSSLALLQEDPLMIEARKYGFRALSKMRWDALKDEYLSWRRKLLDDICDAQDNGDILALTDGDFVQVQEDYGIQDASNEAIPPLTSTLSYPPDCLILIRNVHPSTNKTTLRTLFNKILANAQHGDAIDYVDYAKGMDNCYLRLVSSLNAHRLISYFSDPSHRVIQSDALDDVGVLVHDVTGDSIMAELVQGRREEIYWEKVPFKVKQEAVRKALSVASTLSPTSNTSSFSSSAQTVLHNSANGVPAQLSLSSPYPPNCLLFVRNVDPGTNKTTLRTLFTNTLSSQWEETKESPIDYVDYTKGTDTCHVRFASPMKARFIQEYFQENKVMQNGPLDDRGGTSSEGVSRPMIVELVQGTKEKIYWEKVPMKVRQDAVKRAVALASTDMGGDLSSLRKRNWAGVNFENDGGVDDVDVGIEPEDHHYNDGLGQKKRRKRK